MLTSNPVGTGADFWRSFYLGRELARRGNIVTLVGAGSGPFMAPTPGNGLRVRPIRASARLVEKRSGYNPLDVFGRLLALRREQFDLIHSFGHRPAVSQVAGWLARRSHALRVADWSDRWGRGGIADARRAYGRVTVGLIDHWLERRNIAAAHAVTVVSAELEDLAQSWGKPPERVLRLGVGAAIDVIQPIPKRQAREAIGIPIDRPVVVHSGLSAFDRPHAQAVCRGILRLDSHAVILILGTQQRRPQGPQGAAESRVVRLGYLPQEQLGTALCAGDLVLIPLSDRGFNRARLPNRVGDAAAAGRPVATNPTGEVGELVRDEGLGIVVDQRPERMAAAVVELLADPGRMEEMGRHARRVAESKWSWALRAERLDSFYAHLFSG